MILHRYVLREILQAFVAVVAVLALVYVSNRFVGYLSEAASGRITAELVLELLVLKLVTKLVLLIPLGLYVAVLLGLGRLYRDSEIVAMSAGGVGTPRIAGAVFLMSLGFCALAFLVSLYVAPKAAALQEELYERAKQQTEITGVVPGQFKEFGGSERVVYVQEADPDGRGMRNVFVQVRGERDLDLLVSERAYPARREGGSRYIVLADGRRYRGEPGSADYVVTRFQSHGVLIEPGGGNDARQVETVPTRELLRSERPLHVAELQWRLSHPIGVVLLAMLAVPLARTSPRQGRYAKLFTGVLVYFVYNNLIGIAASLVERGELSSRIGVWPVHAALALVVVAALFTQSSGHRRLVAMFGRRRP